jgi:C4-dicarboxylate-specific signal transduction histidine kinase
MRSLEELLAGIAHELNQPLTAVLSYSQAAVRLLERDDATHGERLTELRGALQGASEQAQRAHALIERLRGMVRSRRVRREHLRLEDVIEGAVRIERRMLDEAGVGGRMAAAAPGALDHRRRTAARASADQPAAQRDRGDAGPRDRDAVH